MNQPAEGRPPSRALAGAWLELKGGASWVLVAEVCALNDHNCHLLLAMIMIDSGKDMQAC